MAHLRRGGFHYSAGAGSANGTSDDYDSLVSALTCNAVRRERSLFSCRAVHCSDDSDPFTAGPAHFQQQRRQAPWGGWLRGVAGGVARFMIPTAEAADDVSPCAGPRRRQHPSRAALPGSGRLFPPTSAVCPAPLSDDPYWLPNGQHHGGAPLRDNQAPSSHPLCGAPRMAPSSVRGATAGHTAAAAAAPTENEVRVLQERARIMEKREAAQRHSEAKKADTKTAAQPQPADNSARDADCGNKPHTPKANEAGDESDDDVDVLGIPDVDPEVLRAMTEQRCRLMNQQQTPTRPELLYTVVPKKTGSGGGQGGGASAIKKRADTEDVFGIPDVDPESIVWRGGEAEEHKYWRTLTHPLSAEAAALDETPAPSRPAIHGARAITVSYQGAQHDDNLDRQIGKVLVAQTSVPGMIAVMLRDFRDRVCHAQHFGAMSAPPARGRTQEEQHQLLAAHYEQEAELQGQAAPLPDFSKGVMVSHESGASASAQGTNNNGDKTARPATGPFQLKRHHCATDDNGSNSSSSSGDRSATSTPPRRTFERSFGVDDGRQHRFGRLIHQHNCNSATTTGNNENKEGSSKKDSKSGRDGSPVASAAPSDNCFGRRHLPSGHTAIASLGFPGGH